MAEISFLNLPPVPEDLCVRLEAMCKNLEFDEDGILWMHHLQRGELTVAGLCYGNDFLGPEISEELGSVFNEYFPGEELLFVIGRISSLNGEKSVAPPHCDRGRYVAINFLLQTGGTEVNTCFFKELRTKPMDNTSENIYHKDVTFDFKQKLPAKTWHCFDVQTFHSVENIESDRLLFSICLRTNPTYEKFVERYKQLVLPVKS
jgi:hypothetical protein